MNLIKSILITIALSIFVAGPSLAAEKAVGYFGWHATGKFHPMGEGAEYSGWARSWFGCRFGGGMGVVDYRS